METRFVTLAVTERATAEIELLCGSPVKVAADRQSLQEMLAALLSVEANGA